MCRDTDTMCMPTRSPFLRAARSALGCACIALAAALTASAGRSKARRDAGARRTHERDALDPDRCRDTGRRELARGRRDGRADARASCPRRERPRHRGATDRTRARRNRRCIACRPAQTAATAPCGRSPIGRNPGDAADLTIAIGSCYFLADPNPLFAKQDYGGGFEIFDAIAAKKPDMMLWLGDNVYLQQPDFLDPVADGGALSAPARVRAAAERCSRRRLTSRSGTTTITARTTATHRSC